MQAMKTRYLVLLVLSGSLVVGCSQDPQLVKRQHLENGDVYFQQNKYGEAIIEYRLAIQADPRAGEARKKLATAYLKVEDAPNAFKEFSRAADLLPEDVDVQVTVGKFLLGAGQFEGAKDRAERILKTNPRSVDAQLLLGSALLGLKDPEAAIRQIEEAIKLEPTESRSYAALGAVELSEGQHREAEAAFRKAVELDPKSPKPQVTLGSYYWSVGRTADAESAYKQALALDPKSDAANRALAVLYTSTNRNPLAETHLKVLAEGNPREMLNLGDYYLRANRPKDAVDVLRPLASNSTVGHDAKVRLAALEFSAGRKNEANKLVDEVLSEQPTHSAALVTKAQLLLADNRIDEALARAQAAAAADPGSAVAQYALGSVHSVRNEIPEAIKAFNEVLRINPRAISAQMRVAKLYLSSGEPKNAVPLLESAIRMQPDNPELHLLVARAMLGLKNHDRAEAELRYLLKTYPKSSTVHTLFGVLAADRQDAVGARKSFVRALQLNPRDAEAVGDLVTLEVQAKRPADARRLVEAYLTDFPDDAGVRILAARTYATTGDIAKAEDALRYVLDRDSSNVDAYTMLGQLYIRAGRLDEARAEYEKVLARNPNSIPANTFLAVILEAQQKPDEAKRRYEHVLELDPNAAVAANNLANLYVERGENIDLALQLAQRAKQLLPRESNVNDTLGWIYYKKNLVAQAIPLLQLGSASNPVHLYHLGMAYRQSGEWNKARQTLERALKLNADFPGADEAKKALASIPG